MSGMTDRPASKAFGRDTDLDDFRALVLIWVVLLHCLYWLGLVAPRWSVAKSMLMFEMPALFFIAGASNSLGRSKGVWAFYRARISRILIPYWVYAGVCFAFEAWQGPKPGAAFDWNWLIPTEHPISPIAPITWHLWFVPVYLGVMALFPWLRKGFERLESWQRVLPLVALVDVVILCDDFGVRRHFPRHLAFYAFWAYLGLYYTSWKGKPWPRLALLGVATGCYFVLWRLLAHGVYGPDFQWNKFPTNLAFFLLNGGHFALFCLCLPAIRGFARQPSVRVITAPYRAYGYTIYLFHALGFALVFMGFQKAPWALDWVQKNPRLGVLLVFSGLVLTVPVLAWPFSIAERFRFQSRRGTPARAVEPPRRLDPAHSSHILPHPHQDPSRTFSDDVQPS